MSAAQRNLLSNKLLSVSSPDLEFGTFAVDKIVTICNMAAEVHQISTLEEIAALL